MREAELLREILVAASGVRMQDGSAACVVWRQQVGTFRTMDGRPIKIGIEGQADIGGILANGRCLQIEVKAPRGKLREGQIRWAAMVSRMRGIHVVARSVDEVLDVIKRELDL